jgi:hypothetical protein
MCEIYDQVKFMHWYQNQDFTGDTICVTRKTTSLIIHIAT